MRGSHKIGKFKGIYSTLRSTLSAWDEKSRPGRTPGPSENEYERGEHPVHIHFSVKPATGGE